MFSGRARGLGYLSTLLRYIENGCAYADEWKDCNSHVIIMGFK